MARIRTIKPEFWDSPSTARASAIARLAFIAMWNWADDFGRGTANLKELEGFIFPNDDIPTLSGGTSADFRSVVAEVVDCFGVLFYTVDGRPYYAIPSWQKHQRNEKRAQAKYPGPDEADSAPDLGIGESSAKVRHDVAESLGSSGLGTGEQGNRGTGEQGNRGTEEQGTGEQVHADGVLDLDPAPDLEAEFERAYEAWPKKVNRKTAQQKFERAARKRSPADLADDIVRFGHAYAATTDRQYTPALDAWINGERWTDELPRGPAPRTAVQRNLDEYQRLYGGGEHAGAGSVRALDAGVGSG